MDKASACHREDVPVASLDDTVSLGDARMRSLTEQPKCAASCSYLLAVIAVHRHDWPTTYVPLDRQRCAVPVLPAHGIAHLEVRGDVLHDEEMPTIIAPHGPVGVSLDHVVARQ